MPGTVGIDLGTTNSCVATVTGGRPEVLLNQEGARLTPSVVAFRDDGVLIGTNALRQAVENPSRTVFSVKRLIGKRYSECGDLLPRLQFDCVAAEDDLLNIVIDGKRYPPQFVSGLILNALKRSAESQLSSKITSAVVTVPAYFNDSQRQATREAGHLAGLNVRRMINEPTAAALAYGFGRKRKSGKIAVFDLGGGTLDVSILDIGEGVYEVLATRGDTELGGDDYDRALVDFIASDFLDQQGIDIRRDPVALARLREAAERAKCELSSKVVTEVLLPFIAQTPEGPRNLRASVSRAKFQQLTLSLTERCLSPLLGCMEDAGLAPDTLDDVILVGGATRMPAVQELIRQVFGKEPVRGINPDEVVAMGAAIQADIIESGESTMVLLDVTPLTLSIETMGGIASTVVPRNTTIPVSKTQTFSTARDGQDSMEVHVVQGERKMAKDNRTLARFVLQGIAHAPRGVPQVDITFSVDADGVLGVSATERSTGSKRQVRVLASTGLSDAQIEDMLAESRKLEQQDDARMRLAESRNKADSLIASASALLDRAGEHPLISDVAARLAQASSDLANTLATDDISLIRSSCERLEELIRGVSREVAARLISEQADKAKRISSN